LFLEVEAEDREDGARETEVELRPRAGRRTICKKNRTFARALFSGFSLDANVMPEPSDISPDARGRLIFQRNFFPAYRFSILVEPASFELLWEKYSFRCPS